MEQKIDWKKEICRRAAEEYDTFIEGLKGLPFEQILGHAYEAVIKKEILELLENGLHDNELKGLQGVEAPLTAIYKEWQEIDAENLEQTRKFIHRCSDKVLEKQSERFYNRPDAPLYRKNLIEAKTSGEIHLWRGDKKRNEKCLDYFEQNSHDWYERRELSSFLQNWVKEFGFERCKTLLAAVITKAAHDGRYSKKVKEHAAFVGMPNITYEDFYSNIHPVIINFAYQTLMEMERDRDSPKGKNGGKPQKANSRKQPEPER